MPMRDRGLALIVALLWGLNFLAIRYGLDHFPPLFFGGLRFAVLAVPTMLFVRRPGVRWYWLVGYGLGFGTVQFAFLFIGMDVGMPTGLASLVLQASAPFTVLLGGLLLRERITARQVGGILLAVAGMAVIGWQRAQFAALLPVLLTLCGALGWAFGNLCSRQARPESPLRLTLWMSVVPPIPMFTLSLLFEGPTAGWDALRTVGEPGGLLALAGLAYVVGLATVVGTGIWTTLMSRHPAGVVAPFSLLVPVVGIATAWLVLREVPTTVELIAGVVVVVGVLLGIPPAPRAAGGAGTGATAAEGVGAGAAAGREARPVAATSTPEEVLAPTPAPAVGAPAVGAPAAGAPAAQAVSVVEPSEPAASAELPSPPASSAASS
ncbi:DMT(drug/metabolite transporter) superfamily permease [Actinoalloteichus sp. GBA129-24]|uniref:DMT(Drug/metabolite transporter) superfamily permease n=1 Tax=Actinoalloteichus fjordicus TaxID=1612552 RepID=A0AAC9PQQ8_9PSEU|nr:MULTISPECIES: EamA family transporter [Actinoalloteichus]APU13414.1 DMT(drug/metabolite transporter) superfamily permease [Actinoalloteichus fjordicus]APU19364.1 DMT(drug/metabolite transporter) superfamily permease [Actinoalloteichus sp. GBA129-24]